MSTVFTRSTPECFQDLGETAITSLLILTYMKKFDNPDTKEFRQKMKDYCDFKKVLCDCDVCEEFPERAGYFQAGIVFTCKILLIVFLVQYQTKRDANGRKIKYKVCRQDSCEILCSRNGDRVGFNNVAYAEVNIIMGFELMTERNKPIVELLYGCEIDDKNQV